MRKLLFALPVAAGTPFHLARVVSTEQRENAHRGAVGSGSSQRPKLVLLIVLSAASLRWRSSLRAIKRVAAAADLMLPFAAIVPRAKFPRYMVRMLKLVESLSIKAARVKHSYVEFIPLRDSGTGTYTCGWCGVVVGGKRTGWVSYRAIDHKPVEIQIQGDVCHRRECRISLQAKYTKR